MTTAFDCMLALARQAGPCVESVATGGSTTTVVDTQLPNFDEGAVDDAFNQGTVFLVTATDGLAPEGETARVTDYVASTGTLTVATFTVTLTAGDKYAVTKIPQYLLLQAVNNALRDAGKLPAVDESLTTAANQTDYTIPAAAKKDLRQVWIARRTSTPYYYQEDLYWRWDRNLATYDLQFPYQPPAGYKIRLIYCAYHADVTGPTTVIQDIIPIEWATWRAAYYLYRWRLHQEGRDDKKWTALMNEAAEYAERYKPRIVLPAYPTRLPYQVEGSEGGPPIVAWGP